MFSMMLMLLFNDVSFTNFNLWYFLTVFYFPLNMETTLTLETLENKNIQ